MRQKNRRDSDVIVDDLAFGEANLRIKNLIQVRYLNSSVLDDELGFIGHRVKRFLDLARNDKHSGKEPLGREHGLWFTDASNTMLPRFVAAEDFDFDAHEINRNLHFYFGKTWHSHCVFLRSSDHR